MATELLTSCVMPTCARFGHLADAGRLCARCGRPLGGPSFGPEPGYRIDSLLGSGYYADVFRALDLGSGGAYAAKVYVDEHAKRLAWEREIAALRPLVHPRLPVLRAWFESDGRLFVVMELVEGASLRQAVETRGPLAVDRALRVALDVCEALEYVASRGWTYRDLHPKNIHPDTPKGAMLVDMDGARPPGWPPPAGRIGYRAPELDAERPVSPACDVYSLVGCLYFALTGDDPPTKPGPIPELRRLLARYPPLVGLLDAGRLADPSQRPSIGALRAALEPIVEPTKRARRSP